jgi:2-(1,2-epoxy-1,2-dihydrophenyl)acetyl-CoA isomerase
MNATETLLYDAKDGIGTLTLNRPERLNAMTNRMVREVTAALREIARDSRVRVLVLTGAGRGFCPGADLQHFTSGASQHDDAIGETDFEAALLLHEMPQVTIAAINGACAGAGFGWACACDLRVAAESAALNSAFLRVASAGDMAGPWTLPRIVGAAKARELYFLPNKFGAAEALRIGLVARVFPDASFRAEVAALAQELAAASPAALRGMKANFVDAEKLALADYLRLESRRHQQVMAGPDSGEAFRAFLEKRAPRFGGEGAR